ncbi:MAG: M48 family metallopeptidase [Streptococcaceae bacterium]|jgi:predicted metal-dependent hydrolase|nr:M48 family metallopeptidase [Streptococcaceae bacterium]
MNYQLTINNYQLTIDVVRKDIKNMHLAVYPPTGRLRIAVPERVTDDAIRLFVVSKLGWIKRNQRNFLLQERQTERQFIERESHYFQGKRYLLNIVETDKKQQVVIKNKTYLQLEVKSNATLETKARIMNDWYRTELKKTVQPFIDKWVTQIGVQLNDWQIKQMKTKWGTCNIEDKRIWINLELAKKSVNCLEYIIVHELIHLIERHHNDRFLALMNYHLPNWKQLKKELNNQPVSHSEWTY